MLIKLPNDKLGFYKVKDKKFYGKLEAILYANETVSDVNWNFNKEVLDSYNWKIEPEKDILELYKNRAKQIRDEYDYVVVLASGGSDSTNVVYSFLKNGIHIDEIVFAAPLSGLSNWNWNDKVVDASNTISETKFAQLPFADEIKRNYPKVKVTVNDYFNQMLEYKTDDWMLSGGYFIHPTGCRYSFDKLHHIKNLAESGKKIARVFGLDKPTLVRGPNGNIFNVIQDGVCQVASHIATQEQHQNIETVLFYFTPDLPELMIKQCHILAKWLHDPANSFARETMADSRADWKWNLSEYRFSLHHRASVDCIYPMLKGRDVFQAYKSYLNFTRINFDHWFYELHGSSRLRQMIDSDFQALLKKINKKYLNELNNAFFRNTQTYMIGHESQFMKEGTHIPDVYEMDERLL